MTNTRDFILSEFCGLSVQIWTVVSLVDGQMFCSVHASEHDAYCEAVSRFESVELDDKSSDLELRLLLRSAKLYGDYRKVHRYIEREASRIQLIQLAEHSVYDLCDYEVRMPNVTITQLPQRRRAELAASRRCTGVNGVQV
jgi:hypothetical protein